MENIQTVSHHHEPEFSTKANLETFWILLGITLAELVLATIHLKTGFPPKYVTNGVYLILTLTKAFYIIAEFMHLRHEIKNLIMTIRGAGPAFRLVHHRFSLGRQLLLRNCATAMIRPPL